MRRVSQSSGREACPGRETMRNTLVLLLLTSLAAAGACQSADTPDATTEIRVEPAVEQNLYSFSRVVLKDVVVSPGVLDQRYPGFNIGDPCLVVQGSVRNMDMDNPYVAMFAYGYSRVGERVAETLDAEGVMGQILLYLQYGETGSFTLHLNANDEIETVRIFAFTYDGPSP